MTSFRKIVLFTDGDGRAKFRDEEIELGQGTPEVQLSAVQAATGVQFRYSPVGFRSQVHCTKTPQWVFILGGEMEVGLADGSSRIFVAGEHFFAADSLPEGVTMDPSVHGHWSRQVGKEPLETMFVKD